jgi:hypothetical protein
VNNEMVMGGEAACMKIEDRSLTDKTRVRAFT